MYNAIQKEKFLRVINNAKDREYATTVFNCTDVYEVEVGYDICNFPVNRYAEIILESFQPRRQYIFERFIGFLFRYRSFCIKSGMIDLDIYRENIDGFNDVVDGPQLDEIFAEYIKSNSYETVLFEPDNLFNYLRENVFAEGATSSESEIDINDVLLAYAMFKYYQVPYTVQNFEIGIKSDGSYTYKDIVIDGKTKDIVDKLLKADIVSKKMIRKYKKLKLDNSYVFKFEDNDTVNGSIKRLYKMYTEKVKKSAKDTLIPTLTDIKLGGQIYAICKELVNGEIDIELINGNELLDVFNKVYGTRKSVNNGTGREFVKRIKDNCKYLTEK